MTEHAALGASSAYRWWACPGSVAAGRAAPPSPPSRFALEGTAAHAVLAWCLTGGAGPGEPARGFCSADETIERPIDTFVSDEVELDLVKRVAGVTHVSEEMAQGVQVHIDYVVQRLTNRTLLMVEHRISLESLNPPAPMFGTADTTLYDMDAESLESVDFKYGRGKIISAIGNPQLRYYGLGSLLDAYAKGRRVKTLRNTIIQPRVSLDPSTETMDPIELYDWHTELMEAARRTQEPDAPLVPGDHCNFCAAAPTCSAFRGAALAVAGADFVALPSVTVPEASSLAPADLVRILDGADLLEQWISSVRSFAKAELDRGATLPGWKLAERVGHRKWKAPVDDSKDAALAFVETLKGFGLKPEQMFDEPSLRSPAQMEKLLKKAQRESPEFKALWHKLVTGSTMVRASSAAPEIASSASKDFQPIAEEVDLLG